MSQPPKSTILAPSARWASLRTVLRVMWRGLLRRGLLHYPRSGRGRASDGRSRGEGGAPALLQGVLSRRAGAPPSPLSFPALEACGFLLPGMRYPLEVRAAGWGGPLGEI